MKTNRRGAGAAVAAAAGLAAAVAGLFGTGAGCRGGAGAGGGAGEGPTSPAGALEAAAAVARAEELPLRPGPGADLDALAPPEPVEARPPKKGSVAPVDLGADRALAKIAVPVPSPGHTLPIPLEDGRRGWVARVPHGADLPTVAYGAGRVYVSGGFETSSFYALDSDSGKLLWTRPTLEDNGPTPAMYVDGNVVFNTESCTLFVLDAATGRTKWHRWLGDPTLAQPVVAGGLVFASYPASGGHRLGAFRLKDGTPVWDRPITGEIITTPVVNGDSVYLSTVGGTTYRFRRADGHSYWAVTHAASSAPWVLAGEVFVARTSKGKELQVVLDAKSGKVKRTLRTVDAPYAADVPRSIADWKKVWSFEGSRPVVLGGRRFDTMGGEIHASDPLTGDPLWIRRYADGVGKRKLTPPAVAGAKVFFTTYEGALYGLDVDTGMTVWAYDLGLKTHHSPIVAKGWIYLPTTTGLVVGLPLGDSTLDGWHNWGGNPFHNGLAI